MNFLGKMKKIHFNFLQYVQQVCLIPVKRLRKFCYAAEQDCDPTGNTSDSPWQCIQDPKHHIQSHRSNSLSPGSTFNAMGLAMLRGMLEDLTQHLQTATEDQLCVTCLNHLRMQYIDLCRTHVQDILMHTEIILGEGTHKGLQPHVS